MNSGLTVAELIVFVEALKDRVEHGELPADTPVVRSDAEWGPRPVQDVRLTKVRDNSPDDTHTRISTTPTSPRRTNGSMWF